MGFRVVGLECMNLGFRGDRTHVSRARTVFPRRNLQHVKKPCSTLHTEGFGVETVGQGLGRPRQNRTLCDQGHVRVLCKDIVSGFCIKITRVMKDPPSCELPALSQPTRRIEILLKSPCIVGPSAQKDSESGLESRR